MERIFCLCYVLMPLVIAWLLLEYKDDVFFLLRIHTGLKVDCHKKLVIGVLSARDHFEQRKAIRETWGSVAKNERHSANLVQLWFIVGERACDLPLTDRREVESCVPWDVCVHYTNRDNAKIHAATLLKIDKETRVGEFEEIYQANYLQKTISFQVQHGIVVENLGVYEAGLTGPVTVKLLDAVTMTEVVSVSLGPKTAGVTEAGYRYKAVEPYLLPKGFQGMVSVEGLGSMAMTTPEGNVNVTLDNGDNVIHFLQREPIIDEFYQDPLYWNSTIIPAGSFIYKVHDTENLTRYCEAKNERVSEWKQHIVEEDALLREESHQYADLAFVSVVDVYRNLPQKLLLFMQWLNEDNFDFLMKTDDDCYADIGRILSRLHAARMDSHKLWWGRFRHNWPVNLYGKWADPDYRCPFYPAFACGSGYVLHRGLVKWLSDNADNLHLYQGEDVAMAIWLAAVRPHYADDPLWQCTAECISDMYTMPEQTPSQMRTLWNNSQQCGDPCGCD